MAWIWSGTHMLQTLWSTVPTKSMVCWCTNICFWFNFGWHDFHFYSLVLCVKGLYKVCRILWSYSACEFTHLHTAKRHLHADCCWILGNPCSLWTEVVVCTVWGSVILPHTGANCTSDCLAHGWAISSDLLAINVMIICSFFLLAVTPRCWCIIILLSCYYS